MSAAALDLLHLARWRKPDAPVLAVRQVHALRAGSWAS